jgi:hypothetical protein
MEAKETVEAFKARGGLVLKYASEPEERIRWERSQFKRRKYHGNCGAEPVRRSLHIPDREDSLEGLGDYYSSGKFKVGM